MLIENADAEIAPFSLDRIVARFGHLAAVREAMLARDDLPAATRQGLVAKLSETLAGFVAARQWLEQDHARKRRQGGLREGDRHARGASPATARSAADPASARERPADRRAGAARAAFGQRRHVRGGAGRALRHAARRA